MNQIGLSGVPALPKKRGRPPTGKAMTPAQRKAKQRENNGLVVLSVEVSAEVFAALNEYMRFKDLTKNELIENLLIKQLLRKR